MIKFFYCAAGVLTVVAISCGSGGISGRRVEITQTDSGCSPSTIPATPGEKLTLVAKNTSATGPYRLERLSGPPLDDLSVPKGGSRSGGYSVPAGDDTYRLSCFVLGGVSTTVQIVAGKGAVTTPAAVGNPTAQPASTGSPKAVTGTVGVQLIDFSVVPDKPSIPAGTIKFNATNGSQTLEHELVVHRVREDGSGDFLGEVEHIRPGETKSLTLDLTPGTYRLACFTITREGTPPEPTVDPDELLKTQEAGKDNTAEAEPDPDPESEATPGSNDIDHYARGMHVVFRVD